MGLTLPDKKNVLVQPLRNERLVCPGQNDHFSFSHAVTDKRVGVVGCVRKTGYLKTTSSEIQVKVVV